MSWSLMGVKGLMVSPSVSFLLDKINKNGSK